MGTTEEVETEPLLLTVAEETVCELVIELTLLIVGGASTCPPCEWRKAGQWWYNLGTSIIVVSGQKVDKTHLETYAMEPSSGGELWAHRRRQSSSRPSHPLCP